ncbi:MAG: hypothetical protein VKJ46_16455 [Leptolyngbyaceae bacterium]|nr:hypothetical protein [Leptolyngbyaceae bacterium]
MPIKIVPVSRKSFTRISIGIVAMLGLFPLWMPESTLAQIGTPQPLQEFKPQDNRDSLFDGSSNSQSGLLDLIHRANLGGSRSLSDFTAEQGENINTAAAEFRALQLKRLQQQGEVPSNRPPTNGAAVSN